MRTSTFLGSYYEEQERRYNKARREQTERERREAMKVTRAAVAADMLQKRRQAIVKLFHFFLSKKAYQVNLLATTWRFSDRPKFGTAFARAFGGISHGNGATHLIANTLCWLREQGHIGIVGFSGLNAQKLVEFIRKAKRLDIRIFPSFEQFALNRVLA